MRTKLIEILGFDSDVYEELNVDESSADGVYIFIVDGPSLSHRTR